ncbi:MAG: aconitate hydratase [Odoribacter sp.]|nr:aconitate hydratase [Odoribacter sp.]
MNKYTFVEKMLNACTGDIVTVEPDYVLSHDSSARIGKIFRRIEGEQVFNRERLFVVLDRKMAGYTDDLERDYNFIRDFMQEQDIKHFYDCDKGIGHEILASNLRQGMIIVGNDSHTCTAGAFNCFAVNLSKTETAYLWKNGKMWFRVPETIKVNLTGQLQQGVYAKDVALWIMGMLKEENVTYKAIEFHGEGVANLSIPDRMTIANVGAEIKAKLMVFPPDDCLADYFGDYAVKGVWADENANYYKTFDINLEEVFPLVMLTHDHNEVKSITECEGLEIQSGFIGACSNGRLEDLREVAAVLKDKKIHPGFHLYVVPASTEIYLEAWKEGLIDIIKQSGASVLGASCNPCMGSSQLIQAEAKRFITTTNSNSMDRLREIGIEKYVASPVTVARTALEGRIVSDKVFSNEQYEFWNNPVVAFQVDELDRRKHGNVWDYGDVDYISCKQIINEKLSNKVSIHDYAAMQPHIMEGLDKNFAVKVEEGDIILAGEGFGNGRLIKHAATSLQEAGIKAIVVKSADRKFFRLANNYGLLVIIAPEVVENYREGDVIDVDLEDGRILLNDSIYKIGDLDSFFTEIIYKKGLLNL